MTTELTAAGTQPSVTLEISDRRLPPRMVAGRLRADLPRTVPVPAMSRPQRTRLMMITLLALLVPLFGATRHRQAA